MVRDVVPHTDLEVVPDDPDKRSYNVSFDRIEQRARLPAEKTPYEGIVEVKQALEQGQVDDTIRTKTVHYYQYLLDAEKRAPGSFLQGKDLLMRRVEFYRHSLTEDDIAAAADVLRSVFLTTGPRAAPFEEAFAEYLGVGHVVSLSRAARARCSCALTALGVGPGDEVITTPMTFVATANAILHTGATPVFVDVEPETGNLDVSPRRAARSRAARASSSRCTCTD